MIKADVTCERAPLSLGFVFSRIYGIVSSCVPYHKSSLVLLWFRIGGIFGSFQYPHRIGIIEEKDNDYYAFSRFFSRFILLLAQWAGVSAITHQKWRYLHSSPLTSIQPPSTLVRKLNVTYFSPKRASILYLTSSSLETSIVGYSNEPAALLPVFGWPFVHLIPYLVLVAFSQIFSVDPPHIGHLKSFIYFHPNQKNYSEKVKSK